MIAQPFTSPPSIDEILEPGGRLSQALPNYESRPQQTEASHAIEEAFGSGRNCLIEAGTGVGKSLAYLIPAVRAAAQGKKTVISTHTINLQTQLMEKDIPLVMSLMPEVDVRPVIMKGRSNYLCLHDLEIPASDLLQSDDILLDQIKRWAVESKTGDRAELTFTYPEWHAIAANQDTCHQKECSYFDRCFYYRNRREAAEANLIVVNHALLLSDLAIRTPDEQGAILPDFDYVVFDEAHHVEDVATKAYGIQVTNRAIPGYVYRLRHTRGVDVNIDRLAVLEELNDQLFSLFQIERGEVPFQDMLDEGAQRVVRNLAQDVIETLRLVVEDLQEDAKYEEGIIKERLQGLARMGARIREELNLVIFSEAPDYVRWGDSRMTRQRESARGRRSQETRLKTLHWAPVDVSKPLSSTLWANPDIESVVMISATLANSGSFSYVRSRLGIPAKAVESIVGSPFDYKQQALLYVPAHLPPPPKTFDLGYIDKVSTEIERLLGLTQGRAFLLFTSRKMMDETYGFLADELPYPLFKQGDMPPARLLEEFRASGNGCLFGTQSFWEGVDVQGEALSCVIIDKLPFSVPDSPIIRARTEAIKAAGGNWFQEYSIPQAQLRLKQGFGRLIRTKEDRGIVCILDTRLLTSAYGSEFVKHLPPASRASIWSRVETFWKNGGDSPQRHRSAEEKQEEN